MQPQPDKLCNWCLLDGRDGDEAETECRRLKNTVSNEPWQCCLNAISTFEDDPLARDKELMLLVAHGATLKGTVKGLTLVQYASKCGATSTLKAVLTLEPKMGADRTTQFGFTSAHLAAARGHKKCLEVLKTVGSVDLDAIDNIGCSPSFYAAEGGHIEGEYHHWKAVCMSG